MDFRHPLCLETKPQKFGLIISSDIGHLLFKAEKLKAKPTTNIKFNFTEIPKLTTAVIGQDLSY